MAIKFWDHLKLKNGDSVKFVPPSPDGDRLGGVTAAEKTQIGKVSKLQSDIADKQDAISDLDTIRSGAAAGAAALPNTQTAINTAVTASLTDSNHLTMTSDQMDTACAVLGAERDTQWKKLYDKTYEQESSVSDSVTLESGTDYRRFVTVIYSKSSGVSENITHSMYVAFTDGTHVVSNMTVNHNADAYVYCSVDTDAGTINTGIKGTSASTTINMYGGTYNGIVSMIDALSNGYKPNRIAITGKKSVGTNIKIYAR